MAITIEQALHPLFLTFSILGFGVFFPKIANLNIFYNLTIWIIYVCIHYFLVIKFKVEEWIFEISSLINIVISLFVIIVSVIMNFYHNKRFQIFIRRLAAVDDTLEKLGTPKIYCKLHTYMKRILIGWLVFINVVNIGDIPWWWSVIKDHRRRSIPFLIYFTNYHYHVNMIMDLSLIIFLWYIGTRFDKLNEHMKCLLTKEEYNNENGLRCTLLTIYRNIRHLHLELCKIVRELNEIYRIQMIMEMTSYMIYLIRYCRCLYNSISSHTPEKYILSPLGWLDVQLWMLLHGIRLFCLNYACESVSIKANETENIIHQITDFFRYADVCDEIYQFTLQMIYHPLRITGFGSYFGSAFLRKFIMKLITYVIVIIQMATIPERYII